MSKYKITNPEYGLYYVFKYEEELDEWVIQSHYPRFRYNLTIEFTSLEEAKQYVVSAKHLDKKEEEKRKMVEAWKPMDDIIL